MKDGPLTEEQILDAAEEVLRRFGPSKTTVVDVARALDVSHGTIYRHFQSKADLRDAVTNRWLLRIERPLTAIAKGKGSPRQRLREWLRLLGRMKRERARDDPELFATYYALACEAREVTQAHIDHMIGEIAGLIDEGVAAGEFGPVDGHNMARLFVQATARFHHPAHVGEWTDPAIDDDYDAVLDLLLRAISLDVAGICRERPVP